MLKSLIFIILCLTFFSAQAKKVTIKIGILTPEGTTWATNMKKLGKEIKKATDGQVRFKVYMGGTAGDESDVLKKIRIKQMQGGIFTGKTLGDINGDVRVMEVPFTFLSNKRIENASKVLNKMGAQFSKTFWNKGFKNLGYFELGTVYMVLTKKVNNLKDLKGVKIWSWEGDKIASSLVKALDLVSIPMALPNVLSSLSSGIVEAAYAPAMGIVGLQWHTKVKYLIDFPITFAVGAFVISKETWNKISKPHQQIIEKLSKKFIKKSNVDLREENEIALDTLRSLGVKFIKMPKKDIKLSTGLRMKVLELTTKKVFTEQTLKLFEAERKKL